jgi:hypothetical protein
MIENAGQAVDAVCVVRDSLDLQYELARRGTRRLGGAQTKIAVALARQGAYRHRQAVEVARDALGFRQMK